MQRPVQAPVASVFVEKIMADWLLEHAQPKLKDPVRYANGVSHWQAFFMDEQRAGRLIGPRRSPTSMPRWSNAFTLGALRRA
ncbi:MULTISPECIES: hypothetical protein [unclassified Sphingomonas]|uniref:hypothetical protein n=1 Tax=unclassified Sphingomonas TaxID=196159 RepID=UPI00082ADB31|nr:MULTISPECIES: hypothetical protein [unclassified Sphingomonas]